MLARPRRIPTVVGVIAILPRALVLLLLVFSLGPAPRVRASSAGNDLTVADAELNAAYQKALAAMPSAESKTKLREAQRAWVAFRDAEVALRATIPPVSGNGLKILQTELTDARTKQLQELAEGS